jgi:hypothetical protein
MEAHGLLDAREVPVLAGSKVPLADDQQPWP